MPSPRRRRGPAKTPCRRPGEVAPSAPGFDLLTELSDAQWLAVEASLGRGQLRQASPDLRRVASAIAYRWRTGCAWRNLPPGSPPWSTVYSYFRGWGADGSLRKLRQVVGPAKASPP